MSGRYTQITSSNQYVDDTYETIEGAAQRYGTFNVSGGGGGSRRNLGRSVDSTEATGVCEGGFLDANGTWRSDTLALRDKPVFLSDRTKTVVRHVWGSYTLATVILFVLMFPFGFCFLPLLPFLFTKRTKWMKNTKHIDPVSNNLIGEYHRGKVDAPSTISFYREPNIEPEENEVEEEESFDDQPSGGPTATASGGPNYRRNGQRRSSRPRNNNPHRQHRSSRSHGNSRREPRVRFNENNGISVTNHPIKLYIDFKGEPVELPDGERTLTRKRIGSCNLVCAYMTYFMGCILFPFPILCFMASCLKDTEHVHPRTKEIVGVHYKGGAIV